MHACLSALPAAALVMSLSLAASSDESRSLFDGQTLKGWMVEPAEFSEHWKADNETLVGENADKKGSILWTTEEFQNFELELEYMTPSEDYDSGVFTRNASHQVQIGVSRSLKKDLTACIYAPKDGQGSYPAVSPKVLEVHKLGEWNSLRIVVQGKRIQTFLNGQKFVDYQAKTLTDKGPIGLQLHAGVHMKMVFRNIRLKELP